MYGTPVQHLPVYTVCTRLGRATSNYGYIMLPVPASSM